MTRRERDEAARRLAASAPPPDQPPSFFEGLGMVAADSVPTTPPRTSRGHRLLSIAAMATGTTVLLSSAAYAGALGEGARNGFRHVLGDDKGGQHRVDPNPAPEDVAPLVVLQRREVPGNG